MIIMIVFFNDHDHGVLLLCHHNSRGGVTVLSRKIAPEAAGGRPSPDVLFSFGSFFEDGDGGGDYHVSYFHSDNCPFFYDGDDGGDDGGLVVVEIPH